MVYSYKIAKRFLHFIPVDTPDSTQDSFPIRNNHFGLINSRTENLRGNRESETSCERMCAADDNKLESRRMRETFTDDLIIGDEGSRILFCCRKKKTDFQ